jgi:NADPH:quinone reductase-like Zn-dependent oxidoreductase
METNAAVVHDFASPPRYESWNLPVPREGETVVEVLAAGLHPRVRSGASGEHYTSTGRLPLVPGIDGVGRRSDGSLLYFAVDDEQAGSFALRAVVDLRRTVALRGGSDVVGVAAAMNPAMSSWVALRRRVAFRPGQSVLVLGATGNAGCMAIKVAKLLGAGRVIAAGRNADRLTEVATSGADATVRLSDDSDETTEAMAAQAAEVDIVLDYLWGTPASAAMTAIVRASSDRSRELNWVQIGAVAGPNIELPSVLLRSANVRLQGNGQGAVSPEVYLAELPSLIERIDDGSLAMRTHTMALENVEQAWAEPDEPGVRTVFVP